jgi:phosphinothricin acetyltransferase
MNIRHATSADVQALMDLRNYYVANSIATFDEQPLSQAFVESWLSSFNAAGPHQLFIAEASGQFLGFASSQAYRTHPAFAKTVETSVYVAANAGRCGVGSALYERLFEALQGHKLHRAVVGIALPNEASVRLHEKFGYAKAGVFSEYALKNGKYISSQWMERSL